MEMLERASNGLRSSRARCVSAQKAYGLHTQLVFALGRSRANQDAPYGGVSPCACASWQGYMWTNFGDEMSRLPAAAPAEMVLRYAFDRGNPARAAAGENVTNADLVLFLVRFGPMRSCLVKAARFVV